MACSPPCRRPYEQAFSQHLVSPWGPHLHSFLPLLALPAVHFWHILPPRVAASRELTQPCVLQHVHQKQLTVPCRRFIWSRREPPPAKKEEPKADAEESTALVLYSDYAESVEWVNMCWRKVGCVCLQQRNCVAVQGGQVVCSVLQGRLLRVPDRLTAQPIRDVSVHVQFWHAGGGLPDGEAALFL